jgi:signal transduction histidine kinase
MRENGFRSAVAAPIVVGGRIWGLLLVASVGTLGHDAEHRLAGFAELVALALESAEARAELNASRVRILEAGVTERRRLERNLHDGAQQRLVALAVQLRMLEKRLGDPDVAARIVRGAAHELEHALAELRELARGLHPAVLSDRGLAPALETLASRSPLPLTVEGVPHERLAEPLEAAVYFVVAESLTNAVKHAEASELRVRMHAEPDELRVEIADDGRGGARPGAGNGTGLRGLADRVEALGGRLAVESPPGGGTTVRAVLPLSYATAH